MAITDAPIPGAGTTLLFKEGDTLTTGDFAADLISENLTRNRDRKSVV